MSLHRFGNLLNMTGAHLFILLYYQNVFSSGPIGFTMTLSISSVQYFSSYTCDLKKL